MLERILRRIGTDRDFFTISNASMNCLPLHLGWSDHPERFPEAAAAAEHCSPYLEELIETMQPRVIVPMGNAALRRVCGVSGIEQRHSYVHPTRWGVPAIPTFHPSYIMQGKHKLSGAVAFALRRAEEFAEGRGVMTQDRLMLDPSPDDLRAYLRQFPQDVPEVLIDIETPESAHLDEDEVEEKGESYVIIRAGFCLEKGVGVTFPFEYPYTEIMRGVLSRAGLVWEWADNHFDTKRFRANGYSIPGKVASGMWCHHMVHSDLPKGLGFVAPFYFCGPPWKMLSDSQPAFYNACDQVRGWDCTMGSKVQLQKEGRWRTFERHCIETEQILVGMTSAGVLVDQEAQSALKLKLETERGIALAALEAQVPESVKKRKAWKRPPKDLAGVWLRVFGLGEAESLAIVWEGLPDDCPAEYRSNKVIREFSKALPFNPDSTQQVAELIRSLGLKVPKDRTTGQPTTGEKHLRRFAKTKPVFRTILDCRKRTKLLGAYIWQPDEHGRIRGTYGFHPSTWRKCVAQGTFIEIVRDLSKHPQPIAIEDVKVGDLAYTYTDSGKPTVRPVLWVGQTGVEHVVRIHWQAGYGPTTWRGHLDVTPDHEVRLTDGSWKQAQHLVPFYRSPNKKSRGWSNKGDTVVALHRGISNTAYGYSKLWATGYKDGLLDHRVVYEGITGQTAEHVHHKDGNKLNNLPQNLAGETASQHTHDTHTMRGAVNPCWANSVRPVGIVPREKLREHLKNTAYDAPVPWCRYVPNNHRVVGVEHIPGEVPVYDIEVQETHNFIAGELCVHNSQRNYNLQTIPKRGPLAPAVRRTLIAAPGHVFVERDSSGIEAVLVGYFAGSERYIRLAKAGVHGWLASCILGKPIDIGLPFEELQAQCKATKKANPRLYDQCKPIVHGSAYLESAEGIWYNEPDLFETPKDAAKLQNMLLNSEPWQDVAKWQKETCERAHRETVLKNPFGYWHYFYDVYTYNKKSEKWTLGEDAKRAVAFKPQSTASAIQTEILLWLRDHYPQFVQYFRLIVHDSLIAEVPEETALEVARAMRDAFCLPWQELGGLTIGAEGSMGRNLGSYDPEANPEGMREVGL